MAEQTIADQGLAAPKDGSRLKVKLPFRLPKVGRKAMIFVGPGLLLLLLAAGGYLYWNGTLARLVKGNGTTATAAPLTFFDLPDFLVNLNSGANKKSSFLKLTVSLQLQHPEDQPAIQAVLPRIIDNCQIFLRELRIDDLRGAGGIYRLREEMLARINAVAPVKVQDVLFKEMLVQ